MSKWVNEWLEKNSVQRELSQQLSNTDTYQKHLEALYS
jgi:hypothetical protein